MPDRSFLAWPFFEDTHRDLARELEEWTAAAGLEDDTPGFLRPDLDAFTTDLVRRLGRDGWLRWVVPSAWGGRTPSLDLRTLCLARETLARSSGLADFAFAMQGLGSGPISLFGGDRLRQRYLPRVAAGEWVAAFALSEAEAGSDVQAMRTTARRDGDGFVLNGGKTWISNAGLADFYVVFARWPEGGQRSFVALVVDRDTAGFSVTERVTVSAPHPLGSLSFRDCRVPPDRVVGQVGGGLAVAFGTLDVFRSTVGAAALGFARCALDQALRWVRQRVVFGKTLSEMQLTRARLADMALEIDASALLVYRAAWSHDAGGGLLRREAAMAKLYATEAAQRVVDAAVQLLGGRGVAVGEPVERLYREVRALRIYEGTSEIQKLVIARELMGGTGSGS